MTGSHEMKNPGPLSTCKLCHNVDQLINSHIVPAALHRILKDQNGKNVRFVLPGEVTAKNQKDLQEFMLCKTCEIEFGKFEKRTIELLKPVWNMTNEGRKAYIIPAASSAWVLRFAHSVFWRGSVSTVLEKYKLAPELEERLRLSLLTDTPIEPPELPVRLDFFVYLRKFKSSNIMHGPAMYNVHPGMTHSGFSTMGLIFSMQSPTASDIVDLAPPLVAGQAYQIQTPPPLIQNPSIAAINESVKLAVAWGKMNPGM